MIYELDETTSVATITLNRPERLNALTFEVYTELRDKFRALDAQPGVRAIVITGAGRAFCSGGDVEDIIGALNGTVAGAGAVIAAACDIRIAAESAKIAFLFTKVGLSGADMGAAWLLPRIVGLGHASELLLTGDFIDAKRALEIGLYNRVVTQAKVLPEAHALAEKLARGPSAALGVTKQALEAEAALDLEAALSYEAEVQAQLMQGPNFREAYAAFQTKREPKFT